MANKPKTHRQAAHLDPDLFFARQQQIERSRSGWSHRHRRRERSNLKYARRPFGWKAWIAALLESRKVKLRAEVIPVSQRPWVPKNKPSAFTPPLKPRGCDFMHIGPFVTRCRTPYTKTVCCCACGHVWRMVKVHGRWIPREEVEAEHAWHACIAAFRGVAMRRQKGE